MDQVSKARRLRREATDAERVLWRLLRNRQLVGWKFRRQTPVGRYIVDFVSFEGRLVVEVDGSQHHDQAEYDEQRTKWLISEGFRVMRFWNNDVLMETDSVLEAILAELTAGTPSPALRADLSHQGRGEPGGRLVVAPVPSARRSERHEMVVAPVPSPLVGEG